MNAHPFELSGAYPVAPGQSVVFTLATADGKSASMRVKWQPVPEKLTLQHVAGYVGAMRQFLAAVGEATGETRFNFTDPVFELGLQLQRILEAATPEGTLQ